jgi:thiol-disulfide isomerase/thioredoxin
MTMRVRAFALALAAAAAMGSAACAPVGFNGSIPAGPPAPGGSVAAVPARSAVPAGSSVPSAAPADDPPGDDTPPVDAVSAPAVGVPADGVSPEAASTSTSEPGTANRLNFTTRTVDGAAFNGASLLGKPTVLWFWAPGCPACRAQVPDVLDTERQFKGKVNVVGVAGLDRAGPVRTFVVDNKLGAVRNLFDTTGAVWKRFKITRQGMYVLLDATGNVRYTGSVARGELAKQVALLGR